jgi:membrane-bound lytic murein transglycosylase
VSYRILIPIAAVTAIAACAAAPERPAAEMSRAQTLIEQAEEQGAQEFAAADLERARQKLRQAETAVNDDEMAEARRLAAEAAIDAEFAAVKAKSGEARKAADEIDRSLESLREEASREPTPPQSMNSDAPGASS